MAFCELEAEKLPVLANIGVIKGVVNCRLSKSEVEAERDVPETEKNHTFDIQIKPLIAHRNSDETFYFWFKPFWFDPNLDPKQLVGNDLKNYRKIVAAKGRRTLLQNLLGDEKYEEFGAALEAFDNEPPSAEQIFELLVEALGGETVGYTLTQASDFEVDDEGNRQYFRTDKYQVGSFFREADWWEKQARKKDATIKIAWEEGTDPLG